MAYTVTKTTGYGQRVSNSFKGIFSGILLFIIGTILLFWNEGRFVKTQKALQEAEGAVVSVESVAKVDPDLNGQLIHATGMTATEDTLADADFGISVVAISLKREVEYFQYVENTETETKDKLGGSEETTTTYTYSTRWVGGPVDSAGFKAPDAPKNKALTKLDDLRQTATNVTFGAYTLPDFLISKISGSVPVEITLTDEQKAEWSKKLSVLGETNAVTAVAAAVAGETTAESAGEAVATAVVAPNMVHVNGNVVYFGKDPNNAQVGDLRVTFTKVMPGQVSIIAKVKGSTFAKYGKKNFAFLSMGEKSAEEMFDAEHAANSMLTWILRIVGLLLVVGGLKGIFGILTTLAKVVPFIASIIGAGIGLICWVLGGAWSLLIIALAWLTYRPIIGIPLLILAVGGLVFLKMAASKNKAQTSE